METQIVKISLENLENKIEKEKIKAAGDILIEGGLVAFPTETVYGLGADGLNPEGAKRIYEAKGRPSDNPLIIHISQLEDLYKIAKNISKEAKILAEQFWPGPLTMVFEKRECVPYETTGGLETIAVRMPSHPLALKIIEAGGGFIAAPSANVSGRPSPTIASHVEDDLSGRIAMIVDGGEVGIGIESTIVDTTGDIPMILRPGYITKEMLETCIGKVNIDPSLVNHNIKLAAPKAPGMKYRHYAPKAELVVLEGDTNEIVEYVNTQIEKAEKNKTKIGIIGTDESISLYKNSEVLVKKSIGSRTIEESIAKHLYRILREFDNEDVEKIYSESFLTPKMGHAIMNRLLKAAGHKVLHIKGEIL